MAKFRWNQQGQSVRNDHDSGWRETGVFAIHLQMRFAICRRREDGLAGA
jgi:hypothetical protein